jgi:hypothetical protein
MRETRANYISSAAFTGISSYKWAVVNYEFNANYTRKPYYLCTVVLFDISKDSDIVHGHELLSEGAIDQYPEGGGNEESGVVLRRAA